MLFTKFALLRVLLLTLPFSGISSPVQPSTQPSSSSTGNLACWTEYGPDGPVTMLGTWLRTFWDKWADENTCPTVENFDSLIRKDNSYKGERLLLVAPGVEDLATAISYSKGEKLILVSRQDVFPKLSQAAATRLEKICGKEEFALRWWESTLKVISPKELLVYCGSGSSVAEIALYMACEKFPQPETTKVFEVKYTHSEGAGKDLKYGHITEECQLIAPSPHEV